MGQRHACLGVDAGLLRGALCSDGGGEPLYQGRRWIEPRQLPAVLLQPELLAGTDQFARGDGDGHRHLGAAGLSLRLDSRLHRARAMATAGADAGGAAVLDVLCGALLFLAAGAGGKGRHQFDAGEYRYLVRTHSIGQYAGSDGDRLRAFLRDAADADDLRQPEAALAQLPQGGGRSRRLAAAELCACHPAADAAGRHGRRLPHLRAGDRRLHHAADPRRQQRASHAAAHHDADRPARRLRLGIGPVAHPDGGGDASPISPAPAG